MPFSIERFAVPCSPNAEPAAPNGCGVAAPKSPPVVVGEDPPNPNEEAGAAPKVEAADEAPKAEAPNGEGAAAPACATRKGASEVTQSSG